MYQYLPIQNEVFSPEIGKYQTFGLRVLRIQDGKDQEIMIFSDVPRTSCSLFDWPAY